MSSSLSDYQVQSRNNDNNNNPLFETEEDPLTPIQSQSTEIYQHGIDESLYDNNDIDVDSTLSETSSVSFELYDYKFSREKIITQIQQEMEGNNDDDDNGEKDLNIGDFLLKHYKYRELTDISNGLGDLIKGIDDDLIELVNVNYLSFINLGKSVDGSLDLIHDIKIDLTDYLKNLKLNNNAIENDLDKINLLQDSRLNLIKIKSLVKKLIKLNEMIECFDKLCSKFDKYDNRFDILKELVGLYFGINKMFLKLIQQINEGNFQDLANNGIFLNLGKKMNGLKLEFKSLLENYLSHLKDSKHTTDEIFEVFKLYQLLNLTDEFKKSI